MLRVEYLKSGEVKSQTRLLQARSGQSLISIEGRRRPGDRVSARRTGGRGHRTAFESWDTARHSGCRHRWVPLRSTPRLPQGARPASVPPSRPPTALRLTQALLGQSATIGRVGLRGSFFCGECCGVCRFFYTLQ